MSDGDTTDVMESLDPSKMLRLGSMTKNLLDEMHAMPLDQGGRERLMGIHARAVAEAADRRSPAGRLARRDLPGSAVRRRHAAGRSRSAPLTAVGTDVAGSRQRLRDA